MSRDLPRRVLRSGTTYVHHFEHGASTSGFDHAIPLRDSNRRLFTRWGGELKRFIDSRTSQGTKLEDLRKDYWLIDLFVSYQQELPQVRKNWDQT